ncbi:ferredoxin [Rhodococcus indonesiensis]|uniref:ferredoxin n=1 Tax=Rhodococcus indonesiensis TaxID=3055869 RepID=UPI0039F70D17
MSETTTNDTTSVDAAAYAVVAVDLEVCEAAGVCTRMVKDVFELDDDDILHIRRQPDTVELDKRVRMAVRRCPKQALFLED